MLKELLNLSDNDRPIHFVGDWVTGVFRGKYVASHHQWWWRMDAPVVDVDGIQRGAFLSLRQVKSLVAIVGESLCTAKVHAHPRSQTSATRQVKLAWADGTYTWLSDAYPRGSAPSPTPPRLTGESVVIPDLRPLKVLKGFTSEDSTRPNLCGVHVGYGKAWGTCGGRLRRINFPEYDGDGITVPNEALAAMKFKGYIKVYPAQGEDETHAFVLDERAVVTAPVTTFPDADRVIPPFEHGRIRLRLVIPKGTKLPKKGTRLKVYLNRESGNTVFVEGPTTADMPTWGAEFVSDVVEGWRGSTEDLVFACNSAFLRDMQDGHSVLIQDDYAPILTIPNPEDPRGMVTVTMPYRY